MTFGTWLGFLMAAILIAITPGPGAVLSMGAGIRYGYRTALMAIMGLQAAILVHLLIVALGFGALLAASEEAFVAVKFIGAAYLIWLGIQKWRTPSFLESGDSLGKLPRGLFLQGLLVNLTNPKAILFIGALVPQFINPTHPLVPQYLLVALTLCLADILVMSIYALAAVHVRSGLFNSRVINVQGRIFGALFIVTGGVLAFSSRPV